MSSSIDLPHCFIFDKRFAVCLIVKQRNARFQKNFLANRLLKELSLLLRVSLAIIMICGLCISYTAYILGVKYLANFVAC